MDRPRVVYEGDLVQDRVGPADAFVLPSRSAALGTLKSATESMAGPVLLTGDTGVGKTWLARRLRAAMPGHYRWLDVDLTPSLTPAGFYRLVLRGLGFGQEAAVTADPASARIAIGDALRSDAADHLRWVLVVDEAQNGSDPLLEELRVLTGRLGTPGSFAGVLLLAQNSLVRRLEHRLHRALAGRLATHVHLRPLALEELSESLSRLDPARLRDPLAIERMHRDVGGNPRLIFQLCRPYEQPAGPVPVADGPVQGHDDDVPSEPAPRAEQRPPLDLSSAVPVRPPLQVGDGVVEVGWDASATPDDEYEASEPLDELDEQEAEPEHDAAMATVEPSEELIEDRYTALQAWNEWTRSQPEAGEDSAALIEARLPGGRGTTELAESSAERDSEPAVGSVRAESEHGFAPYSQLFSRLRLPNDTP